MKHLFGKLACWIILRFGGSHVWRRLRKGERTGQIDANWRICDRCERMKTVKQRKPK